MFNRLIETRQDYGALLARVTLGLVIFPHGAQKLLGWFGGYGFAGTMAFFTQDMHIPALFAFLAIVAEFFGAIALVTGLVSRVAALAISTVMVVAVLTGHLSHGFFMNWFGAQTGEGFEFHLLALGLGLITVLKGGGAFSLDGLLSRSRREIASQPAQVSAHEIARG